MSHTSTAPWECFPFIGLETVATTSAAEGMLRVLPTQCWLDTPFPPKTSACFEGQHVLLDIIDKAGVRIGCMTLLLYHFPETTDVAHFLDANHAVERDVAQVAERMVNMNVPLTKGLVAVVRGFEIERTHRGRGLATQALFVILEAFSDIPHWGPRLNEMHTLAIDIHSRGMVNVDAMLALTQRATWVLPSRPTVVLTHLSDDYSRALQPEQVASTRLSREQVNTKEAL